MEGDDGESSALSEQRKRVVQAFVKHVELVVYGYADSLKGLARRVSVASDLLRNIRLDDFGKLKGSRYGLALTRGYDPLCD